MHEPCPSCGSKDNLARYPDGHAHCFGADCKYHEFIDGPGESTLPGSCEDIPSRGISKRTCQHYNYRLGSYKGKKAHFAVFPGGGYKVRLPGKDFRTEGLCEGLWGQHLWGGGKMLVVTEGELDTLALAECYNCKWPVVSVPHGVSSAPKAFKKSLEWLLKFETVVLMFDMDSPGQLMAKEVAELLPPGRCKIAHLSEKDPCEMLAKGKQRELQESVWKATVFRPDGIIAGVDTWDLINTPLTPSDMDYPWQGLNAKTLGARKGELVTFCAGTGAGKSTASKEIAAYFRSKGATIGYLSFEESVRTATIDFMSIEAGRLLHLEPDLDEEYKRTIWEKVFADNRLYLYDHFGSLDSEVISNRIRYLVHSCGVEWIFLDHISIMVSGMQGGDERRLIDNLMTNLRSLAEELRIGMFIVSHLRKPPEGKGFEDGKQISINDLRGSGAIGHLSDFVIGLERDQQEQSETVVRVLKARFKGSTTGVATRLIYDPKTGRLSECNSSIDNLDF